MSFRISSALNFFSTMIPIDCKITIFFLYLFVGNSYNIGELTRATSKERMTMNIILRVPHPLINESLYTSKLCILVYLSQLHSIIDREKYEKYLFKFFPLHGNTEDSLMTVHAPMIDESQ